MPAAVGCVKAGQTPRATAKVVLAGGVHRGRVAGKALGIEAMTKGSETEGQMALIDGCGRVACQGSLFAKALPTEGPEVQLRQALLFVSQGTAG